jgi:hypothetical protein
VSLMHPTVGEMIDRLTLLELKFKHGLAAGKDVSHFAEETYEIAKALEGRWPAPAVVDEMRKIHELLWELVKNSPNWLLSANEARHALREKIDMIAGEYRGPEKV